MQARLTNFSNKDVVLCLIIEYINKALQKGKDVFITIETPDEQEEQFIPEEIN